jgi:predicted component of type VI protein secretion system
MADGQRHSLVGVALVGRGPAADARWPGATLITVVDGTKTVSKTHAAFQVDASGLWVIDLQSSNGVLIAPPGGAEIEAEPGALTIVRAGSVVMLGDFKISVEHG